VHLAPFTPLNTSRLDLVALKLEDAPFVFAYASDPEISGLVAWRQHGSLADSRRFIARSMVGYAKGGHYTWGIMRRTDEAFIGTCGFGGVDIAHSCGDLNYVLARRYWGQGYATEAAAAVMQFGFKKLRLRFIEAQAFQENTASFRVMAKLGLRYSETTTIEQESSPRRAVCIWRRER